MRGFQGAFRSFDFRLTSSHHHLSATTSQSISKIFLPSTIFSSSPQAYSYLHSSLSTDTRFVASNASSISYDKDQAIHPRASNLPRRRECNRHSSNRQDGWCTNSTRR